MYATLKRKDEAHWLDERMDVGCWWNNKVPFQRFHIFRRRSKHRLEIQMVKGITSRAWHTVFNVPPRVQDVQSMIITGTNYGNSVRAGLNIPLLYICFNMRCIMAGTMTTNMAFQLQPPSSVGGSLQGAGERWVQNWFVWLYLKCRTPTDV